MVISKIGCQIVTRYDRDPAWLDQARESVPPWVDIVEIEMPRRDVNLGDARADAFLQMREYDYVFILDDDDWIVPDVLEKCVTALESDDTISLAYTLEDEVTEDGTVIPIEDRKLRGRAMGTHLKKDRNSILHTAHHLILWRMADTLPHIDSMRGFALRAESVLLAEMLLHNAKVKFIPEVGYKWRQHGSNSSKNAKRLEDSAVSWIAHMTPIWAKFKREDDLIWQ
jgi:glycosyltransferase involved in cell wall biosynthesis